VVDSFYVTFLRRHGDAGGEQAWVQVLESGGTQEQVMAGLLSSVEFANVANNLVGSGDANANFIQALYMVVLQRSAGTADMNAWLGALGRLGRSAVAQDFVSSAEFRTAAVATFYGDPNLQPLPFQPFFPNLLHRPAPPADSEIAGWVNANLDLLDLEIALAQSQEYYDQAQRG
jgi:hypothetical protein